MTCKSSKSKYLKAFITLGIILFCTQFSFSQREPQYTQYMYNIGSFNPAYVGTVESMDVTALYRAQWIDIPGAPRTIRFGTNIPFANDLDRAF